MAIKLFSVTVQPCGEQITVGKDNLLLRQCVIKRATFSASKLFSVTVQPWGERIPVVKDNLLGF